LSSSLHVGSGNNKHDFPSLE